MLPTNVKFNYPGKKLGLLVNSCMDTRSSQSHCLSSIFSNCATNVVTDFKFKKKKRAKFLIKISMAGKVAQAEKVLDVKPDNYV